MQNANEEFRIATPKAWLRWKRSRRFGFTWTELLVCLAIIAVFVMLLLPTVRTSRGAARRMQCSNNLKQIALALINYESQYKVLPPAFTVDANGNRLHSWRSLILPFLEQTDLYDKIDFSKAWDDPANEAAYRKSISVYRCPSGRFPDSQTIYMAIVGEHNCLRPQTGRLLTEIIDGVHSTAMIFETEQSNAVHWMCPQDASEDSFIGAESDSAPPHDTGRHACMADGSVQFLSSSIPIDQLRGLATIDGHEEP